VSVLSPYESAINLGPGGRLLLRSLLNGDLRTDADLVILSACESGVSGLTFGSIGHYSLPGGFLNSGAAGVIGSLWQAEDDATALLMIRLYRNLITEQMPPARALREAQLWLSRATEEELMTIVQDALAQAPGSEQGALAMLSHRILERSQSDGAPYANSNLWGAFAYFGAGSR